MVALWRQHDTHQEADAADVLFRHAALWCCSPTGLPDDCCTAAEQRVHIALPSPSTQAWADPAGFRCDTSLLRSTTTKLTYVHQQDLFPCSAVDSQTTAGLTMRPTWKAACLAMGILDMMAAAEAVRLISWVIQDTCMCQTD